MACWCKADKIHPPVWRVEGEKILPLCGLFGKIAVSYNGSINGAAVESNGGGTTMALLDKQESRRCVETVWGKLIPEKEAYDYAVRQIASFCANVFQVMRVLEPDFEKRTSAICDISYMMNMAACSDEYLKDFFDEWNIPEFCRKDAWLGGIFGDSGDEYENMAGRVIQFTHDRVEKELDTCPWDIVGAELCNMTTAMFTANFDLANNGENIVALNMCEARGCGDCHCRVVAERRDKYGLDKQGWMDHMQQPVDPVHDTPRDRMVREGQIHRNDCYSQAFGEEKSFEWAYRWCMEKGWVWCVAFPLIAIRDMAESEEEFERIFKIVFSTAGKNAFIEPFAVEGLRAWLGVPHEIGKNDPRLMGGYIKNVLDCQLVPCELERFTKDEVVIKVDTETFNGRFPMAPIDELTMGYEALWHNMVKTMVSAEWSCWFEGKDDEEMFIHVGRKIDKRMI
jgi:hypothetical protein